MTSNSFFKKLWTKAILFLTIACLICFSALLFVACGNTDESSVDDPTFSYTETDNKLISNGAFSYGTANVDFTSISSLPKTSVTGWTKSSSTSDVNSGVVEVSADGWETLISKLCDDSDFITYAQSAFNFTKDSIKEELKAEAPSSTPNNTQIKERIIEKYFSGSESKLPNPGKNPEATDNKIYMLNNYDKDTIGHGLSQNITSSSTITLEKGNYGKFTVWVRTQNLKSWNGQSAGAYIAVNSNFNATKQAQYRIDGIVANTEWKQYTIYIKADEVYDTSVSLVLGLGTDSFNAVEGTVYFDDVTFEHISKDKYTQIITADTLTYASDEDVIAADKTAQTFLYDMTLDKYVSDSENGLTNNVSSFKKDASNLEINCDYTTSNTGIKGDKFAQVATTITDKTGIDSSHIADTLNSKIVTLDKASYTLTYKSNNFSVAPESYVYVEFYVKNNLSKFGNTNITFDVFEDFNNNGTKDTKYKTKAVASVSEIKDEWQKVGLIIKNNFTSGNRAFIIDVVIGPTDVASATTAPDYASGNVIITNPLFATGEIAQYDENDIENLNYKIYSLFSSSSNGSLALYAGMQQDYVEDIENIVYSFKYSASDIGAILSHPATPNNYTGVVPNHVYILDETDKVSNANLATDINSRSTEYGSDGNFAGIINTEFVDDYQLGGIKTALGFNAGDDNIQPLMIYNNVATDKANCYGYLGEEKSISASSYAKVSVDVRVVGTAVAYIYLVDVSEKTKDIMEFDSDNVVLSAPEKLYFKVTKDMMDDDGWTTVTFYVATGATAMNFRVELWNGSRDGVEKSSGFVFFNNVTVSTSSGFSEPTSIANAFTNSGNPLYDIGLSIESSAKQYTRKLTDTEKQFNSEQSDSSKLVSYNPTYVWAKNDTNIYAIFNTIDPVEIDPYANESEDEETSSGCTAETDPSTFWLSFSSILLGVVLVLAILMLIFKNIRHRRKANASDAKSHFKVVSRSRIYKPTVVENNDINDDNDEQSNDEVEEEVDENNVSEPSEEQLDSYVYGEVQDFGSENSDNETETSDNE